jgi:hypothetical protein
MKKGTKRARGKGQSGGVSVRAQGDVTTAHQYLPKRINPTTKQLYNIANIRALFTEGFDDQELRTLCFDIPDFRTVYEQFAAGMSKVDIIQRLIEYAERHMQMETLLALARELNPARYDLR